MPTTNSVTEAARTRHRLATQKALAASDASHAMRKHHGAEMLASDARHEFRNMGQTLVPLLLDELDEARRLLAQRPAFTPSEHESKVVDDALRDVNGLPRYIEVSRGRSERFMVTLWQLDESGEDRKIGHGEGPTLAVATQHAMGNFVV